MVRCLGSFSANSTVGMDPSNLGDFGRNLVLCIFWEVSYALSPTPKTNHSPTTHWAFVDLRGASWGFVGLRGPSWAFVGLRGISSNLRWTFVGFDLPSWQISGLVQGDFGLQHIFFSLTQKVVGLWLVLGGGAKSSKALANPKMP